MLSPRPGCGVVNWEPCRGAGSRDEWEDSCLQGGGSAPVHVHRAASEPQIRGDFVLDTKQEALFLLFSSSDFSIDNPTN